MINKKIYICDNCYEDKNFIRQDRSKFIEFDFDKNWDIRNVDGIEEYFGPDKSHFSVKGHKMFFEKYIEPNLPIELDVKV